MLIPNGRVPDGQSPNGQGPVGCRQRLGLGVDGVTEGPGIRQPCSRSAIRRGLLLLVAG